MEKRSVLKISLMLLFLLLFNYLFFFLGGTKHPASVWIAYAFIHLSYGVMVLSPLLNRRNNASVLSLSASAVCMVWFLVELIVGTIIILAAPAGFKFTLVLQIILLAVFLAVYLTALLANDKSSGDRQ